MLVGLFPPVYKDKEVMGVSRIDKKKRIVIPQEVCSLFSLKEGDKMVWLLDKDNGNSLIVFPQRKATAREYW